jgi:hypothetical protein
MIIYIYSAAAERLASIKHQNSVEEDENDDSKVSFIYIYNIIISL